MGALNYFKDFSPALKYYNSLIDPLDV